MTAYKKALDEVKSHVMTELKTPIVITNETVSGSVNDLPSVQGQDAGGHHRECCSGHCAMGVDCLVPCR